MLCAGLMAVWISACSDHKHSHGDHGHGHVHTAPHGGTLVEIGQHAFNLEFVRDPAKGLLTAYVLDGHAENFVRLPIPSFSVAAELGGKTETLVLSAVANSQTGEKVGDTSQFEVTADFLKSPGALKGAVPNLEIRGQKFESIQFTLPETKQQ